MTSIAPKIVLAAVAIVTCILIFGLINMVRGGSSNRSQILMRWRVGLQFVAIIIIMLAVWWRGS